MGALRAVGEGKAFRPLLRPPSLGTATATFARRFARGGRISCEVALPAPHDTLRFMKALLAGLAMILLTLQPVAADDATPAPGPVVGIGAVIKMVDHHPVIEQVVPGNPADKSGLKAGDRIVKINDMPVDGIEINKVAMHLRGVPGSRVKVTILRHGNERSYNVKRQVVMVMPPTGMDPQ